MKKSIPIFLALLTILSLLSACGENTSTSDENAAAPVSIQLGALKGPTTIGMVKLLENAENGISDNQYNFTLAAAADELVPLLLKNELDVIAIPINLCSTLYQNGADVQLLAINTLGVIDIVEKGSSTIHHLEDLRGKTIYATGKGTTPEYALTYLLAQKGLVLGTDVLVEWKSEPTEVIAQMALDDSAVAMLPQPFVTVAQTQLEGLRLALDLTQEWDALNNGSRFLTAGLIARRSFIEEHPQTVALFLEEYAASAEYVRENAESAAPLVEKYGIVKSAIAQKAIPYCGICCITGEEMQEAAQGYLQVLFEQNPSCIGGALPSDDFYYLA